MLRLDSLFRKIDVLKIDTEGMDLAVLEGLGDILGDKMILVVEVWPSTYDGIMNWLNERSFSIVGSDELGKDKRLANIYALRGYSL